MKTKAEKVCDAAPDYYVLQGILAASLAVSRADPLELQVPEEYTEDFQRTEYIRGWKMFLERSGQPWNEALEMFDIIQ